MQFRQSVKDDKYVSWTSHSRAKMAFYRLSPQRIKSVLKHPLRKEVGIAKGTLACMQRAKSKNPYEIWVMYTINSKLKNQNEKSQSQMTIISAWRYPGITKPGTPIPIPEDVLDELRNEL